MADADSSITESSLAHSSSTAQTSLLDSVPNVIPQPDRIGKGDRRASLGLIDAARMRLSMDLHTLLRSNSKSQRTRTVLSTQAEDPEHEHLVYPKYAKVSSHIVDLEVRSMDGTAEERPGRAGLGARIANFLNRSRSRSRSKKRRSRSLDGYPVDPMPDSLHPAALRMHARHSSLEQDHDGTVAGPSRPATRIPSRPLSGMTTATNVTVKPRMKKAPEQIAVAPAASATAELVAQLVPMEATKSNSSRKGKRINIFGILLPSPRKGSFSESMRGRSRPTTPSPAPRAPEQAWRGSEDHAWTDKSGSQRSQKSIRKGLPVHVEEPPVPCLSTRITPDIVRSTPLPNLISPEPRPVPVHIVTSAHRDQFIKPEANPDTDATSLDGRCSPLCGLGNSSKGSYTSQEKGKERERMQGTRDRSTERGRKENVERITNPRRVGSPMQRVRESTSAVAVTAVPLQKTSSGRSGNSKHSGSKEHHHGHPRSGAEGLAARTKRIKHGSFDFERPVSAGTAAPGGMSIQVALRNIGIGEIEPPSMQRSNSARGVPIKGRTNETVDGFAPSSLPNTRTMIAKGKKAVSDVHFANPPSRQIDNSMSSPAYLQPPRTSHSQSRAHATTHTSRSDHGHRHHPPPTSPMSTSSGESSGHTRDGSWGRSNGKRSGLSHGAFKFEPAVPPIPGSPADNLNERRPAPRSASRPTSPTPVSSSDVPMSKSKHARLAGKGRSLDLGLGLNWAPSRVREEAVLLVRGPRSGVSSSTSSVVRARSRWRGADEEGRLTAGAASDVAEAFKEALGDSAYGIFKNYVHRFDANAIPLDGPYGLLVHIERLLDNAPGVDHRKKRVLLEKFKRVVQDSEI